MEGSSDWSFRRQHRLCLGLCFFRWGDGSDQMSRCNVVAIENAELTPPRKWGASFWSAPNGHWTNHWMEVFWVSEDRITPVSDCALSDEATAATKWLTERFLQLNTLNRILWLRRGIRTWISTQRSPLHWMEGCCCLLHFFAVWIALEPIFLNVQTKNKPPIPMRWGELQIWWIN